STMLPGLCAIGTPMIVAVAWWVWRRERQRLDIAPRSSNVAALGLAASSVNVVSFYGLIIWSKLGSMDIDPANHYWEVRGLFGNSVGIPAICVVLLSAVFGQGRVRGWLAASVLTGFLMWVPVAFI